MDQRRRFIGSAYCGKTAAKWLYHGCEPECRPPQQKPGAEAAPLTGGQHAGLVCARSPFFHFGSFDLEQPEVDTIVAGEALFDPDQARMPLLQE
jgi:hypothetical protein